MKAKISPSIVNGKIHIPPSKSMAHRSIICASLAKGTSTIKNVAYSKDIIATIEGMRQLGAKIETYDDYVVIEGINDFNHLQSNNIFCNESGSTLRFFIPIFSLTKQKITFSGAGRLMQRPQTIYEEIFKAQGLSFIQDNETIIINDCLKPSHYELAGDVSSQFISGLLFTLPLLNGDSTIHIKPPFESKSYVLLTIEMLERFNIKVEWLDENTIKIKGNQTYQACDYTIEGDYSQLAFFAVLAAINHDLEITGVNHDSKQGDKQIIDILKDFNVKIEPINHGYKVYQSELKACDIDLANCPDLGPILCILASFAQGKTKIYHAGRLRIKESDRIQAMEDELNKLNLNISSTYDEIFIEGLTFNDSYQVYSAHNDHRIVMALSVLLSKINHGGLIEEAQAIEKSYPTFFEDYQLINGKVDIYD